MQTSMLCTQSPDTRTVELRAIFEYELPDPSRVLFLQAYDTPNAFTCFPKLPMELRLIVWKLAFPAPASVNVNPVYRVCKEYNSPARIPQREAPITLRINHESRMETQRQYTVLEWNNKGPPYINTCTRLCLDPVSDIPYISYAISTSMDQAEYQWTDPRLEEHADGFSNVRQLEIRQVVWGPTERGFYYLIAQCLIYLKGLRILYLTTHFPKPARTNPGHPCQFPGCRLHDAEAMKAFREHVAEFFELNKVFFGGQLPEVRIRSWQPLGSSKW